MIFCGNRDQDIEVEKSLIDSLFSLTSDDLYDLHVASSMPSSLLFVSEVLRDREPRIDWFELLQREIRNHGL